MKRQSERRQWRRRAAAALLLAALASNGCSDSNPGNGGPDLGPVAGRMFWSPEGIAATDKYILVANTALYMEGIETRWGQGFVTIIDRAARKVVGKVPTSAANPQYILVRGQTAYIVSSGQTAYVGSLVTPTSAGSVDIIDLSAGAPARVTRSIPLPLTSSDKRIGAFGELLISPDGKTGYIGSGTRGDLFKVDLAAGKVLRGADKPLALFSTKAGLNGLTHLRPWGGDGLAVINLNSEELCLSKDWAGDLAKRTCHPIKVQKNQNAGPTDLAWTADGEAMLLMTLANALYRVDVQGNPFKVTGKCASTGLAPNRVLAHGGQLYIVNSLTANLQRVDPKTCQGDNPLTVFPTGSNPYDLVITKEGGLDVAWVSLFGSHGVAMVDLKSGTLLGTITGGPSSDGGALDAGPADQSMPDQGVGDLGGPPLVGAATVEKVTYGAGAGFGQAFMPGVIQGGPQGGGSSGGSQDVLSLGEGGEILLSFGPYDIVDGPGPDFIVFENPMLMGPYQSFAEPALVGVSAKGTGAGDFADFPCDLSKTQGDAQTKTWAFPGCAGIKPVLANVKSNAISPVNPLEAGGDAFDLSTLSAKQARYLRLRDAGVSKMGATSRGFDLDAVVLVNYKKVR